MTADEEDWTPQFGPWDGPEFKWGLNGETGAFTIWEVGGPGDGFPGHGEMLTPLWGRDDHRPGDQLGVVLVDAASVKIYAFYAGEVPPDAVEWAKSQFPEHRLDIIRKR